jgi:hypothetical protein
MTTDKEWVELKNKYGDLDTAFNEAFLQFKKQIGNVKTALDVGYKLGHIEERQRTLAEVKDEWNKLKPQISEYLYQVGSIKEFEKVFDDEKKCNHDYEYFCDGNRTAKCKLCGHSRGKTMLRLLSKSCTLTIMLPVMGIKPISLRGYEKC